jgi:hypothetical protein
MVQDKHFPKEKTIGRNCLKAAAREARDRRNSAGGFILVQLQLRLIHWPFNFVNGTRSCGKKND